jgi:hypothetical protein
MDYGGLLKEEGMKRACSMHGENENYLTIKPKNLKEGEYYGDLDAEGKHGV